MTSLLTPEVIYQLDTFTLQEKIEELQSLADKALYLHIIRMAKIELIDRLEIEEFGRQLANDQYKVDLDFNLPPVIPPKTSSLAKPVLNVKQFLSQYSPAVGSPFVTVGKPAVSQYYKPKQTSKQAEKIYKPNNFLKAKKSSSLKPKMKESFKKQKESIPEVVQRSRPLVNQMFPQSTLKKQEQTVIEQCSVKQELSLKQKLRREVKQMHIVYHQNDAYDDMKVVKMIPLNMKQEEDKLLQNQHSSKESNAEEQISVSNKQERSLYGRHAFLTEDLVIDNIKEEELKLLDAPETRVQDSVELKTEQNMGREEQKAVNVENSLQIEFSQQISNRPSNVQGGSMHTFFQPSPLPKKTPIHQSPYKVATELPPLHQTFKEAKSKSMKQLNKLTAPRMSQQAEHCQIVSTKLRQTLAYGGSLQSQKRSQEDSAGIRDILKMKLSRYDCSFKAVESNQTRPLFHYNQIIPTFQKLFPHSKNALITLRVVEENLRQHFSKNINTRSVNDDARRLATENDLTFKVIYESEKAKKHNKLFNISLDSYYQRSSIMLDRVRNTTAEPQPEEMLFYRVVRTKEEVYDIVNSSFHRTNNWYELPHGMEMKNSWNLLWTWSRPQIDFSDLFYFQKVNHFLGNKQIARKDLLKKNIQKIQKLGNKIKNYFDIIPQTFLLPGENIPFIKKFRENSLKDPLNFWILKPVGLSRGRGISLINKLQDVVFSEPIILQKYINNPLLLEGYKFDIRIYVLVTSINPLEAFIYQEGFARLSTEAYSLSQDLIDNKFIHLTNFSIQRENLTTDKKVSLEEQVGGSKISLRMLAHKLQTMGIEWSAVQKQIQQIVLKSLIACMNVIPPNPNSFELFGYDIFLDQNHKCWLLEVNSSPSLEKEFILDQVIKQQLVDDIIEVVHPLNYDRQRMLEVVERRRREAEGLKSSIRTNNNSVTQLNEDLDYILHGQKMRRYGEGVRNPNFRMIAPSDTYHRVVKVLQQYKIEPIIKKDS